MALATGSEARRGAERSPASLVTWQVALYVFVLGVLCVLIIPLTDRWWIVPLLGVAGPLLLAVVGGRPRAEPPGPLHAPELDPPRPSADRGDPTAGPNERSLPASPRLDGFPAAAKAIGATPEPLDDPLSEREREVLAVLATGRTTAEAARDLFVSVGTIKSHTANIYRKLGARNRAEAIARARELGLLP
jgi:DNA-binding CsgD family transcriptional regulator